MEHTDRGQLWGSGGRLCERRFLYHAMKSESGPSCASWWQRIIPTMLQLGLQNSMLTGFFSIKMKMDSCSKLAEGQATQRVTELSVHKIRWLSFTEKGRRKHE